MKLELPLNCTADYYADFLKQEHADELYRLLVEDYSLPDERRVIEAGGKMIETDCFKILFSTEELIEKNTHPEPIHGKVYPFAGAMAELRQRVEDLTATTFELAMCLWYPDGNYFAPFHWDQDTSGSRTIIPSISLGEVRRFCFRERDSEEEVHSLDLAHGSLLAMGEWCQNRYEHSLPKDPAYKNGRINITFRERSYQ